MVEMHISQHPYSPYGLPLSRSGVEGSNTYNHKHTPKSASHGTSAALDWPSQ